MSRADEVLQTMKTVLEQMPSGPMLITVATLLPDGRGASCAIPVDVERKKDVPALIGVSMVADAERFASKVEDVPEILEEVVDTLKAASLHLGIEPLEGRK